MIVENQGQEMRAKFSEPVSMRQRSLLMAKQRGQIDECSHGSGNWPIEPSEVQTIDWAQQTKLSADERIFLEGVREVKPHEETDWVLVAAKLALGNWLEVTATVSCSDE